VRKATGLAGGESPSSYEPSVMSLTIASTNQGNQTQVARWGTRCKEDERCRRYHVLPKNRLRNADPEEVQKATTFKNPNQNRRQERQNAVGAE